MLQLWYAFDRALLKTTMQQHYQQQRQQLPTWWKKRDEKFYFWSQISTTTNATQTGGESYPSIVNTPSRCCNNCFGLKLIWTLRWFGECVKDRRPRLLPYCKQAKLIAKPKKLRRAFFSGRLLPWDELEWKQPLWVYWHVQGAWLLLCRGEVFINFNAFPYERSQKNW